MSEENVGRALHGGIDSRSGSVADLARGQDFHSCSHPREQRREEL